jgi:thioredoxin 1
MAVRIKPEEFETKVIKSEQPVLVDFYTDSCIACKQMAPVLGELEDTYKGKLTIVKVNAAYAADLVEKYHIMGAPTLVIFRSGEEVKRFQGVVAQEVLEQAISEEGLN